MEITEVRIKLMDDPHDRLQAFCSITLDECFVIRDLKIIQGAKGSFVAMPSRKLTDRCPRCGTKNHLRSQHCNQCGVKLDEDRALKDDEGRAKLYADIAHPINSRCRELIQDQVLAAYSEELVKAKQPGYLCSYDDYGEDRYARLHDQHEESYDSQPSTTVSSNGHTHRYEPAATSSQNGVSKPHHSTNGNSTNGKVMSGFSQNGTAQSSKSFGEGLI